MTVPRSDPVYVFPIVCNSLRKLIATAAYVCQSLLTNIIAVYTLEQTPQIN